MKIAQVQFAAWDKAYDFSLGEVKVVKGDFVIVETELGQELGRVSRIFEGTGTSDIKPVIRKASYDDVAHLADEDKKKEALDFCHEMAAKHGLEMKLIDVHFSFSGNRLNFAFVADGRVDFRSLVKDLAARFNANIRLTQIGTRDEAKMCGDCGPCGRALCCRGFLRDFSSITSEMAEAQQVVHRGSERISGMCGRLMCCLAYEYIGYKEMDGELPPVGTKIKINGAEATIIGHNILKQTVNVKINPDKENDRPVIIEFDPRHKESEKPELFSRQRGRRRNKKIG